MTSRWPGSRRCGTLASITFVNCGNPFNKDGRALFESRGFAKLDIAYS